MNCDQVYISQINLYFLNCFWSVFFYHRNIKQTNTFTLFMFLFKSYFTVLFDQSVQSSYISVHIYKTYTYHIYMHIYYNKYIYYIIVYQSVLDRCQLETPGKSNSQLRFLYKMCLGKSVAQFCSDWCVRKQSIVGGASARQVVVSECLRKQTEEVRASKSILSTLPWLCFSFWLQVPVLTPQWCSVTWELWAETQSF